MGTKMYWVKEGVEWVLKCIVVKGGVEWVLKCIG